MSDRPIILKSFDHNVTIIERDGVNDSKKFSFEVECKNTNAVKHILKKHRRFAFYNHMGLKSIPKNEWTIFELFSSKSPSTLIPVEDCLTFYKIKYKIITSQKHEPNPRQVTLLRTLGLIL